MDLLNNEKMINFLFILFLIGILIASFQDLRRREVDNYVNFFLLVSGMTFAVFFGIFNSDWWLILFAFMSLIIMFVLANVFYYGRIFAGGDAKLMIAMAAVFAASSFFVTLQNIGIFIILLLVSGSIYGLVYSIVLFTINFREARKEVRKKWNNSYSLIAGISIFIMLFGFFNYLFFIIGIFMLLILLLFVFALALEKVAMIKTIDCKDLREGDWLSQSVNFKGKRIEPNWEGLTKKQVKLLKGYKKKITIKGGLPFVPAFLFAFLAFVFREQLLLLFLKFFG